MAETTNLSVVINSGVSTVDKKKIATEKVLRVLQGQRRSIEESLDEPLLPPVVRWFNPSMTSFILERPPGSVRVGWSAAKGKEPRFETIPTPWTLYCIRFYPTTSGEMGVESLSVFWGSGVLARPDQRYVLSVMPNHYYSTGRPPMIGGRDVVACATVPEGTFAHPTDAINAALGAYWSSTFNSDIISPLTPELIGKTRGDAVRVDELFAWLRTMTPLGLHEHVGKLIDEVIQVEEAGSHRSGYWTMSFTDIVNSMSAPSGADTIAQQTIRALKEIE